MRPTWDQHFAAVAKTISLRADCTRRQVGAVVVRWTDTDPPIPVIVSTGYNGAPPGEPGCMTSGACPRGQMTVQELPPESSYDSGAGACIAIHAEANALLFAGRERSAGGTLYLTDPPCPGCRKLIQAAGVVRVVHPEERT